MEIPQAINLGEVAKKLAGRSRFKRLERSIISAGIAQSCSSDLRECGDCIDAINDTLASPRGVGTVRRDTILSALLTKATLLYGRATVTGSSGGERGSVAIHDALVTDEAKQDHQILKAVRNRAVAHVHNGEQIGDLNWHRSAVLVVKREQGWTPAAANHRVQFDDALVSVLRRQQPIALTLVVSIANARLVAVAEAMKLLSDEHFQELGSELNACSFDAVAFFGSVEEAYKSLATTEQSASSQFTVRR